MTENLTRLLLRLSEAGEPAILWGRLSKPYLGREFDRLLARGILAEEAPATDWDVCASCECGLDVRPIRQIDGHYIAACPYDHRSDKVLDAEDLRNFRIVPAALVRVIAVATGFKDEPKQVMLNVWHLGHTDTKRVVFLALTRPAVLAEGLIAALRLFDRSSAISLVSPEIAAADRMRFAEAGILTVPFCSCIGIDPEAHAFTIDRGKLEPAPEFAPRLVIQRGSRTVVLDGTTRALSEQSFSLLTLLAGQVLKNDPFITTRNVEDCIWGDMVHRVSREARDVVRELREALSANSPNPESDRRLIENTRNRGWRITLTAAEIELRP